MPETGTVPEMLAVTLPICAVPATNAGRVVRDTGCVPWKNVPFTVTLEFAIVTPWVTQEPMVIELPIVTEEMLIGTVPLMLAVTLPICAVPADNAGSELIVRLFPTVTVPLTVTALARSCTSVRPPVTVTCPMVTVMLSSALSDVGPSSTVPVTVLLVA